MVDIPYDEGSDEANVFGRWEAYLSVCNLNITASSVIEFHADDATSAAASVCDEPDPTVESIGAEIVQVMRESISPWILVREIMLRAVPVENRLKYTFDIKFEVQHSSSSEGEILCVNLRSCQR